MDLPNSIPTIRCNAPTKVAYRMTNESSRFERDDIISKIKEVNEVVTSALSVAPFLRTIPAIFSVELLDLC
jgi:hypothetical protein